MASTSKSESSNSNISREKFSIPDDELEERLARIFSDEPDGAAFAKKCAGQIIRHHQKKREIAQKERRKKDGSRNKTDAKRICIERPRKQLPETTESTRNDGEKSRTQESSLLLKQDNISGSFKDPSMVTAKPTGLLSFFTDDDVQHFAPGHKIHTPNDFMQPFSPKVVPLKKRKIAVQDNTSHEKTTPVPPQERNTHVPSPTQASTPTSGGYSDTFGINPTSPKEQAYVPEMSVGITSKGVQSSSELPSFLPEASDSRTLQKCRKRTVSSSNKIEKMFSDKKRWKVEKDSGQKFSSIRKELSRQSSERRTVFLNEIPQSRNSKSGRGRKKF